MGRAFATLLAAIVAIGLFPWSARAGDDTTVEERMNALEASLAESRSAAAGDSTATYLSIALDSVVALAAVGGLVVAALGLGAWRKQLRGQTEYDLARRLLLRVYMLRNSIGGLRSPWMLGGEIEAAQLQAGKGPEARIDAVSQDAAVYSARWSRVAQAESRLRVVAVEAEVLWGSQAMHDIKRVRDLVSELFFAIQDWLGHKRDIARAELNRGISSTDVPRAHVQIQELEKIVYGPKSDPKRDTFTPRLDEAISAIESFARPHLRR